MIYKVFITLVNVFMLLITGTACYVAYTKPEVKHETVVEQRYFEEKNAIDAMRIAREFIPKLESFHPCPYWDVEHYSIGYGTRSSKQNACIDKHEATIQMNGHIYSIAMELMENYPHIKKMNKHLFASIISFRYNFGAKKFSNTYLAYLLKNKAPRVAIAMELKNGRKNKARGEREYRLATFDDFDYR